MAVTVPRQRIDEFMAMRPPAVVGVSRSGKGFGNLVYKSLKEKGYEPRPVHPEAGEVQGDPCAKSLADLPAGVGGVVLVVKPEQTEKLVREAKEAGIPRVWMQLGAESDDAIRYCEENGLDAVHGECILMYAEPVRGIHRFHRFCRKLFGRMPR